MQWTFASSCGRFSVQLLTRWFYGKYDGDLSKSYSKFGGCLGPVIMNEGSVVHEEDKDSL